MATLRTITLNNGLHLVMEPMASVASVAVNWLVPVGSAADPDHGVGCSTMLAELVFRGAGGMSSLEHSNALDRCGVQRGGRTLSHHLQIDATCLGERLAEALPLLASLITAPALDDDAVEPIRRLCLQTLDGLQDDPQHLVMLNLRERCLPAPFNRNGYGERAVIETVTGDILREHWKRRCVSRNAILAVAGAFDPDELAPLVEQTLDGFAGEAPEPAVAREPIGGAAHIRQDTSQTHIALAYNAPHEADEHSMFERLAISALGGSTSGRLFTEVRQRRSLCYSVGASYRAGRDRGHVSLYAGTTAERAQQTLDVCLAEIHRITEGITEGEFERAVTGLKSQLIMHGESTAARAGAIASDQFRLGRARTLKELTAAVDAVTLDQLNAYLARRAIGPVTLASIGPDELTMP